MVFAAQSLVPAEPRDEIGDGHGRDAAELEALLRETLREQPAGAHPNLARILGEGTDTYGREQLEFTVDLFLDGLAARLG